MKKLLAIALVLFAVQFSNAQASMSAIAKNNPIPFETVENKPMFPGGLNEFIKYVAKNFKTPEVEDLNGVLKVTFIIETTGKVSDVKVINDLGHGTAQEITRVLLASPTWTAGDQDGKPVRVQYTLPVTIRS